MLNSTNNLVGLSAVELPVVLIFPFNKYHLSSIAMGFSLPLLTEKQPYFLFLRAVHFPLNVSSSSMSR